MTTSGTYAFLPNVGEIAIQAYRRIGIQRNAVDAEKITDARSELNALLVDWANDGPNLWAVDMQSVILLPGVSTYTLDAATLDILDAWVTSNGIDRPVTSISRTDYAAYPNKALLGWPVSFWHDRLTVPTVTFYPVPDASTPYVFNYFRFRRAQDAALANGQTPDVPYRWIDALIWDLAERLAFIHAPDRLAVVALKAKDIKANAASADTEDAPVRFTPMLSGYFNR